MAISGAVAFGVDLSFYVALLLGFGAVAQIALVIQATGRLALSIPQFT